MKCQCRTLPLLASSLLISSQLTANSERFPGVDLWVPQSYQYQYLQLLEAAAKAEVEPYCDQLLSGRLLEAKSTSERPIFYFRCRTEDKKTFSIQIDGKTMAVTNTYLDRQREKEAKAKAEEERKEAARRAALQEEQKQYWHICREQIKKRLKLFDGLSILTKLPPDPEYLSETTLVYNVDFDAVNPAKKPLHYTVKCEIKGLEDYEVKLGVRRGKKPRV